MSKYFDVLLHAHPVVIAITVLLVLGFLTFAISKLFRKRASVKLRSVPSPVTKSSKAIKDKVHKGVRVGVGFPYPCILFEPGKWIYTTISEPVGTMLELGPGHLQTGPHYFVCRAKDGKIIDWDFRNIPIIENDTPFSAWDKVINVLNEVAPFHTETGKWWQNVAVWLTVACLFVVFIVTLAVIG